MDERCTMCNDAGKLVIIKIALAGEINPDPFSTQVYLCKDCQRSLQDSIWEMITLK